MTQIKRYHPTVKAAREYIAAEHPNNGLRIWRTKSQNPDKKFWIGTQLEWFNRY